MTTKPNPDLLREAYDWVDALVDNKSKDWTGDDIFDVIEAIACQPRTITRDWYTTMRGRRGGLALQAILKGLSLRENRLRFKRKPLVVAVRDENGRVVLDLTDTGKLIAFAMGAPYQG